MLDWLERQAAAPDAGAAEAARRHQAQLTKPPGSLGRLVSGRVITEESELDGYNTDWLKTVRGWLVHGSTRPVTQFVSGTGLLVGAFTSNIGRWAG